MPLLTDKGSWQTSYSGVSQTPVSPQGSASFVYNGDGLRVRKTEAGVVTNFTYDGVRVKNEWNASWAWQVRYALEGDGYYNPLVLRRTSIGQNFTFTWDNIGSVMRMLDTAGNFYRIYSYDAFGNKWYNYGSWPNPHEYVGSLGYYSGDSTTGLMHVGARYYNPSVGRFTTRDPARDAVNSYWYASASPVAYMDASGESAATVAGACAGGAAAVAGGIIASPYLIVGGVVVGLVGLVVTYLGPMHDHPREEQKKHVRCKRAYRACTTWCRGLEYPFKPEGYHHEGHCKKDCAHARGVCNRSRDADTSAFPHLKWEKLGK